MLDKQRYLFLVILAAVLIFTLSGCSHQKEELIRTVGLTEIRNWQYYNFDSSVDSAGIPLILSDSTIEWKDYDLNNPTHFSNHYLWARAIIPENRLLDPNVFIPPHSLGQSFEVYMENKLIYKYGVLKYAYSNKYFQDNWHSFRIPKNSKNKFIYFRFYSNELPVLGFRMVSPGDVTVSLCNGDKLFSWIIRFQLDESIDLLRLQLRIIIGI